MAPSKCRRCGFKPLKSDYALCPSCGEPTRLGVGLLRQRDRARKAMIQLEKSFESGRIPKGTYEEWRRIYSSRLEELDRGLSCAEPAAPSGASGTTSPPPSTSGVKESVIYSNPPPLPWYKFTWYIVAAGVLVFVSVFLVWQFLGEGLEWVWLQKWYLFAASLTGPAIYLIWMYRNDKFEPEPKYFVTLILGWGAFAGLLSFTGNTLLDMFELNIAWLSAPLIEETMKGLGVYLMARSPEFNDSLDGMVYGFAAGMGFAWVENFFYIVYVYQGDPLLSVLRVFVFGYGHGIYTALTGMMIGKAKVRRGYVVLSDVKSALIPGILAHAWYNSFLIGIFDLPALESLLIWLLLTHGVTTLILLALVRRSWREEKAWYYDRGLAPTG